MDEQKIKESICDIGSRIYKNGFVAANDGNITVKLNNDEFLTTPTGVSKGYLTPDMIVKVNAQGEKISGEWKPSSEVKIHLRVYAERPDVGAVVHAHPPYATTFAVAHIPLDTYILPEAVVGLGAVPLVPYAMPSSTALADSLIPYLKKYNGFLLENHGTVTVGPDLMTAYFKTETIEYYAKILYLSMTMGKVNELSRKDVEAIINTFIKKDSIHPGYVKF